MKLADIEAMDKELLLMADIAPFIGADPQNLRSQAQANPNMLGFPVIVVGTRVMVPKAGFVHYMKYGRTAV